MAQASISASPIPYFRRDQKDGITGPDLTKSCTFSEHIVHARGKRTQFTSITLDVSKCRDFGESTYRLKRPEVDNDGHFVIEHQPLISALGASARLGEKDERARAIQALRYAKRRLEGLVDWRFDITRVERKDMIAFADGQISRYFAQV
jgi:hypothetical protein